MKYQKPKSTKWNSKCSVQRKINVSKAYIIKIKGLVIVHKHSQY